MAISGIGLLDGLTATGIIISAVFFGLLSFYKARKLEAKLLAVAGLMMVMVGCFWLGPMCDFLSILITGSNLNPPELYVYLSYVWVAPGITIAMYLGSELMMPEKKWIIVVIFATLGLIFEIFLFLFTSSTFVYPLKPANSGDLIDSSFNRASVAFILIAVFLVAALVFLAIGFLIKAKQATGELRKKFTFLSIGFFIFVFCAAFDSILPPGIAIGFVRAVMMTFALWMYLVLRT